MGCDIHLHTEIKVNGKWEHYGNPSVDRNYRLFALMAGVRNDLGVVPICEPKGLPNDLAAVTAMDYDRMSSDAHTPSWFGKDELIAFEQRIGEARYPAQDRLDVEHHIAGYLFGNSWAGFYRYPNEGRHGVEAVRFVFWFDN